MKKFYIFGFGAAVIMSITGVTIAQGFKPIKEQVVYIDSNQDSNQTLDIIPDLKAEIGMKQMIDLTKDFPKKAKRR